MRVRRLTEVEFLSRGAGWNALLASSRAGSFFLRHDILATWWRHFGAGRTLCVLEMTEGDRLAGFAPLCVTRETSHGLLPVREVAFLGREALTGDYLDFIATPGREAPVVSAALGWLLAHGREWDLLRVSDVLEGSPTLQALALAAAEHGTDLVCAREQTCPYLPLPGTWEELLGRWSANLRSNLRRREKKLATAGALFSRVSGEGIPPALDAMFMLHGARWQTRGRTGNFVDPRTRALHHALAPALDGRGELGFWTLALDGRIVATLYGFRHRETFHYFQAGFDPACAEQGVGLALMGHAIRSCIEWGVTEFDFLRGDEDYKRRWTQRSRRTLSFVVPRPGIVGWSWKTLDTMRDFARQSLVRTAAPMAPGAMSGE